MAKKVLSFAQFQPPLWDGAGGQAPQTANTVLEVEVDAPDGSGRDSLRTKFASIPVTPNDAFNSFLATHDLVKHVQAYADTDGGGGPDPNVIEDRTYIQPKQFPAHEFRSTPGQFYMAAPETVVRQMFRRFKASGQGSDTVFNRRIVQIRNLEEDLVDVTVVGYKLANVQFSTPVATYEVTGQLMTQNIEVQDAKAKAGDMKAITFNLQSGNEIVRVQIAQNGAVTFLNYPGDDNALTILGQLEQVIAKNSDLESTAGG